MRASFAILTVLTTLTASSASLVHAEDVTRRFAIPSDDGYGMNDCLAEGGTCAKMVADSWCQSNGMKTSIELEAADPADITASLGTAAANRPKTQLYIVSCRN